MVPLALLAVLALSQLLLPWIAERVIAGRIGRYGTVREVSVSAWPALRLLWGSADSVRVRASSLALSPEQTAGLLELAAGTARVDVEAEHVLEGPLLLRRVLLRKRGDALAAEALADGHDVAAALPPGVRIGLVSSSGGEVTVRVGGGVFGLGGSVLARARAEDGKLIARPLLPGTSRAVPGLRLSLFSDPRVALVSLGAQQRSADPLVYRLTLAGRLR